MPAASAIPEVLRSHIMVEVQVLGNAALKLPAALKQRGNLLCSVWLHHHAMIQCLTLCPYVNKFNPYGIAVQICTMLPKPVGILNARG
jgi:hypothetical protein